MCPSGGARICWWNSSSCGRFLATGSALVSANNARVPRGAVTGMPPDRSQKSRLLPCTRWRAEEGGLFSRAGVRWGFLLLINWCMFGEGVVDVFADGTPSCRTRSPDQAHLQPPVPLAVHERLFMFVRQVRTMRRRLPRPPSSLATKDWRQRVVRRQLTKQACIARASDVWKHVKRLNESQRRRRRRRFFSKASRTSVRILWKRTTSATIFSSSRSRPVRGQLSSRSLTQRTNGWHWWCD